MPSANTINGSSFDAQARVLQLDERVSNLRAGMVNLEAEMRTGFTNINGTLANLSSEFRSTTKTQWPLIWTAIGVCFAILGGVGAILYAPIVSQIAELKQTSVFRQEFDAIQTRGAETRARLEMELEARVPRSELDLLAQASVKDRERLQGELNALEEHTVARNEWMERNRARDTEMADMNRRIDEILRQIGNVYGTRDIIQDLQEELGYLRRRMEVVPPRINGVSPLPNGIQ